MLHAQKQRIVTSSWIKMFLGRQHPGCWPRQLYCFSPGWVSGQSEVMQNMESKTSSDGNESAVHWWFTLFFFNSFPVVAFITHSFFPVIFLYLFFFPSLSYSLPWALLTLFLSPFWSHRPCSDASMWPNTGNIMEDTTCPAESQDGFQGRLKASFVLHSQSWVRTAKHTSSFIICCLIWCLTNLI